MALSIRVSNWHVPHFNDELAKEVDVTHDVDVLYRACHLRQLRRRPNLIVSLRADTTPGSPSGPDIRKVLSHRSRSSSLGATPSSCSATSWRGRCSRSRRLHPPERPERLRLRRAAAVTARVIDELHLFVHPVLAGSGLRLFEAGTPEWPLGLRSSGVDAWELDRRWTPRPAADGRAGHPTGSGVGRLGSHRRHEAGPGTIDEAAVDGCEQAAAYSRAATALTHRPHQPGPIWLDLIEAVFIVDGHSQNAPRPGP